MAGLRRICKIYGSMKINGTLWLWDYAADEPVEAKDMPVGGKRWKASMKRLAELNAAPQDVSGTKVNQPAQAVAGLSDGEPVLERPSPADAAPPPQGEQSK